MELAIDIYRGAAIVSPQREGSTGLWLPEGNHFDLTTMLSRHFRGLLPPAIVSKPRGTRGFSFHWSNALASWDVRFWNDPTWHTDGAEFLVYFTKNALSPAGKPWSLSDMRLIAAKLRPHPGYALSPESAGRVASRFLEGRV